MRAHGVPANMPREKREQLILNRPQSALFSTVSSRGRVRQKAPSRKLVWCEQPIRNFRIYPIDFPFAKNGGGAGTRVRSEDTDRCGLVRHRYLRTAKSPQSSLVRDVARDLVYAEYMNRSLSGLNDRGVPKPGLNTTFTNSSGRTRTADLRLMNLLVTSTS